MSIVSQKTNIPYEHFIFIFAGKQLCGSRNLKSYSIINNSTIHATSRIYGGAVISKPVAIPNSSDPGKLLSISYSNIDALQYKYPAFLALML